MKMDKYEFMVPQKAAIRKGEKFLIIKRASNLHTYPEYWDFPGGRLEHEENAYNGLKREVKEETNLDIKKQEPVFVFSDKLPHANLVYIVYKCELTSGEIKLSEEHTEFKWATKEEILKLKCESYLRAYLQRGEQDAEA